MKKKVLLLIVTIVLVSGIGVITSLADEDSKSVSGKAENYQEKNDPQRTIQDTSDGEDIIFTEEVGDNSEEKDLTNHELDNFIEAIEDEERQELMTKYFYLGSKESNRIQEIKDLPVMEQAEILKQMPIEELRAAAERIESAFMNKDF